MKSFLTLLLAACLSTAAIFGQTPPPLKRAIQEEKARGTVFPTAGLFKRLSNSREEKELSALVRASEILQPDWNSLATLYRQRPRTIALRLPYQGRMLTIELMQFELLDSEFKASTNLGETLDFRPGVFYRGIVSGSKASFAAITLLEKEVVGMIQTAEEGALVLGRLQNDQNSLHVLYRTEDLKVGPEGDCQVLEVPGAGGPIEFRQETAASATDKCVKVWLEAENDLVNEKGGALGATNFLTALWNIVATLYQNDGVTTTISQIFNWTTPDPFSSSSTSTTLNTYRTYRNTNGFTGDLAHLVSRGAPTNGGIAYVGVLCNRPFSYAYSWIQSSYEQLPTYSWTVNVLTHEMGHNLGPRHTHDCVWNGNNTPIDGCGPTAGFPGTGCFGANGPVPPKGTIMSYCHLLGNVGIDLNLGFGPQPGDLIRANVAAADCLSACDAPNCPTVTFNKTDVACKGQSTGSATATPVGGTQPFGYIWSTGAQTATVTGLGAGTYTVTVTDAGGCAVPAQVVITEPALALSLSTTTTNTSGANAGDGAVDLTVTGGTTPYSYAWSNNATTQDLNGVAAGTYSVTVTDNKGCQASASAEVQVSSSSPCQELISDFPYSESFEAGLGSWVQSSADNFDWQRRSGSSPNLRGPRSAANGSFYLFVQDNGQAGTAELAGLCFDLTGKVDPRLTFAYNQVSVSHQLRVVVRVNGAGPATTVWSFSCPNRCSFLSWEQASIDLSAYADQLISVSFIAQLSGSGPLTDIGIDNINFTASQLNCVVPTVSVAKTDVSCNGGSNGSATVNVSGGTPPFTYNWSTGAQTAGVSNLTAGIYRVTVTGSDNCTVARQVTIEQPAAIQLSFDITPASDVDVNDGAIDLSVDGGTSPYSYAWSNGASTQDVSDIPAGAYTVTVTDNRNCSTSGEAVVEVSAACNIILSPSYNEGFESGLGNYLQSTRDQFDWTRQTGSVQNRLSGPNGAFQGSWYMIARSIPANLNKQAWLISPCFDLSGASNPRISFAYHMSGVNMGSLAVDISTDNGRSWVDPPLWQVSGNQGANWLTANVNLSAYNGQTIRLRFRATIGNGGASEIAIDALNVSDQAPLVGGAPAGVSSGVQLVSLQPNPASERLLVRLNSPQESEVELGILDATGRLLQQGVYGLQEGENTVHLDVARLERGMYLLSVTGGQERQVVKLMIVR